MRNHPAVFILNGYQLRHPVNKVKLALEKDSLVTGSKILKWKIANRPLGNAEVNTLPYVNGLCDYPSA